MAKPKHFKIGRDAGSGEFRSVRFARNHPKTAMVETIKRRRTRKSR